MNQPIQSGNLQPLIPEWTEEDFDSEKPYEWLWSKRNENKFVFVQLLNKAIKQAAKVGVTALVFRQYWKAYCEAMSPKQNVIGANITDFPDQPKEMQCSKYICDMDGVRYFGRMGEEIEVIRHPLLPVKRIVDVDTNEQRLQLDYCRIEANKNPDWHSLIVSRETLASAQRVISLSRNGIAVNSENAKEVVKYLSELETLNYSDMETQKSTGHMGWLSNGAFAPFDENICFGGESSEFARIYADMHSFGDENVWLDIARRVRSGNSVPARIALAASFAAPLLKKMGALSFFVHFWGLQGTGKTVALMLAASVWGNPQIGNYIKSFSGTKVSQELFAAFCCNLPVLLDELQVISDRRLFDDIIYSLCEGMSKGRGAKEGGLRAQQRWETVFLTTGEMPIVQSNSGGGAAVRTIEVNYGGEPFFDDPRTVANTLKENYGFAGRRFLAALQEPGIMDDLKKIQNVYFGKLSGTVEDKQVISASILLAADKLATIAIFGDNRALTVSDIQPYLITKEEADANGRCYQWLLGYIAGNPRRFQTDDNSGELWGVQEGSVVYIIKPFFDKMLQSEGYSPGAFLTWAKRNHKIICEDYGEGSNNRRCTKRKRINGSNLSCVALRIEEDFTEVIDDDMPF